MSIKRGLIAALALAVLPLAAADADPQPNVVVFLMDDVGMHDLSPFGGSIQTPAIGQLAGEGMRMENFHATPVCSTTRASLLTGRYNHRMGIMDALDSPDYKNKPGIPDQEVTIAEMLGADYGRAIIGKWHLGGNGTEHPLSQGFRYFYGMIGPASPYNKGLWSLDWWKQCERRLVSEYTTTATTRESLNHINNNAAQNRPFFLYTAYQAPHRPFSLPGDLPFADNRAKRPAIIQLVDKSIEQIMARVRQLPGKTFVLFSTDNGSAVASENRPYRGAKVAVYEGGVRVPTVAWMPGVVPAGAVNNDPLHMIDVLPTVAEITGKPLPTSPIDGRSFASVFAGKAQPQRRMFFSMRGNHAVTEQPWKLVLPAGNPAELYNLAIDPGETNNLAGQYPAKVAELRGAIDTWLADVSQ